MPAPIKPTFLNLPVEIQEEILKQSLPDTWRMCQATDTHTVTATDIYHTRSDLNKCSGEYLQEGDFSRSNPTKDLLLVNKHLSTVVRRILLDLVNPTMIFCSHICARRFNRIYPNCPFLQPGNDVQLMFRVQLQGLENLANAPDVLRDPSRGTSSDSNIDGRGQGHGRVHGRGPGYRTSNNKARNTDTNGREDGRTPNDHRGAPPDKTARDWAMSMSEMSMDLKIDHEEMHRSWICLAKRGVFQRVAWDAYLMTRTYKFVQRWVWMDEGIEFWC